MPTKINSVIHLSEVVDNLDPHQFADDKYFPAYINQVDGTTVPALFTHHEMHNAMYRASRNPEDIPPQSKQTLSEFLNYLITKIKEFTNENT